MALFQKSVIKNYLNRLNSVAFDKAWAKYQEHFHNPEIQENIRNSKEEQYQEGFLNDLFVNVLGYIKNPSPDFNLTTELKNIGNAKKTDGAILKEGKAVAVIELKGTDTADLGKVVSQAFGYKNHQPSCNYVLISNFEKLRFYIEDATEFESFNLFELEEQDFKLLWLCLSADNLLKNLPQKIKNESLVQEEKITKQLYKDYSSFRAELFEDIQQKNSQYDKLTLFNKTQKLLDRFLFIFFAEDKGLLRANTIGKIIMEQDKLTKEFGLDISLYDRFKEYFNRLNVGYKNEDMDIFAYNGGLFAPDELLDSIQISNDILRNHTFKLSAYDFESDVSVNILGHIFEHSLGEIEEIQRNLSQDLSGFENLTGLKRQSKRKKDGIFYTPKYITQYIVDNTVGKLCQEKKETLGIKEEEYEKERKGRQKTTLKKLQSQLKAYREWLLEITICDPACGSGAFLNQALEFLIAEHRYIDELENKLLGGTLVLSEVQNSILENNLYGVDINEESVEIAKLSLWLRTAQRGRKLTTLNDNIKAGNSLIDDPAIAGDKAFDWEKEFPHIFEEGGFDVVIGNPPYGASLSKIQEIYLSKSYETFEYQVNTYAIFYEKGINLLKEKGLLAYISPANFIYQHYFKKLRFFFNQYSIYNIRKYEYEVFDDANIGDGIIWGIQKKKNEHNQISASIVRNKEDNNRVKNQNFDYAEVVNSDGTYALNGIAINMVKVRVGSENLGDIAQIIMGIKPYQVGKGNPKQTKEIVTAKPFTSDKQEDKYFQPYFIGKDFYRYSFLSYSNRYLKYGSWLAEPRETAPFFDKEKIIIRQTADKIIAHLDITASLNLNNVYNIGQKTENYALKYLLTILNSKLFVYIYQKIAQEKGRTFPEVKKTYLSKLPIKTLTFGEQKSFIKKADVMLAFNKTFEKEKSDFLKTLQEEKGIKKISKKLDAFYTMEYDAFKKELSEQKVKINLGAENNEWRAYFNSSREKLQDLQRQIQATDKEIDAMVYELYDLTEEEIQIVENS